ncbi:hypothetical protein [Flavobacterium lacustre]|uniref:hypothetical protein n=1 Tax=Flavobacterium lacustre TaxID=3016339 RepID=UPI0022B5FD3C|nr:hypothetical protein [Flavobacterium lacustre]
MIKISKSINNNPIPLTIAKVSPKKRIPVRNTNIGKTAVNREKTKDSESTFSFAPAGKIPKGSNRHFNTICPLTVKNGVPKM